MSFEEFQDGPHGNQLGYWNRTTLGILNHCVTVMPPMKFGSIQLTVWEMLFVEFQDGHHGSHHGYWNGTNLAVLNLCVTAMLRIKFWLNSTYGLGGDVV